jgi:hypothetical protein
MLDLVNCSWANKLLPCCKGEAAFATVLACQVAWRSESKKTQGL